ncbi:hypothetical protein FGB62_142g074 [Gracilaria domingensis]|nr:hypothetical protein FGB62_142g074 [Gracilaria domingensis]
MPRRSARIQQTECNAVPERARKRPRLERLATEADTLRTPLADVSNATTIVTRAKSRLQQPAKPTKKAYKRPRSAEKSKNGTENRLRRKQLSQTKTVSVTAQTKSKDSRTRATQERDVKEIEREESSEKLSTALEQRKRVSESSSILMESSSRPKRIELDPKAPASEKKPRAPSSPSATRESTEKSRESPLSQPKHGNHPKPSRRSPSPPPLYPEDEIQPVTPQQETLQQKKRPNRPPRTPSPPPLYPEDEIQPLPPQQKNLQQQKRPKRPPRLPPPPPLYPEDEIQPVTPQPKTLQQKKRPKRPPRPPSPPPLYPEDEIQPLPTKVKRKPSYGVRSRLKEVTNSKDPELKPQTSILPPSIPLAMSRQSPTLPSSSKLLEHEDEDEDEIHKPSLLDELSTAEYVTKTNPRSRIVKASLDTTRNRQLLQKSSSAVIEQRAQTPGFRSEMEERSIYRSQIGSKAPAPTHTYSKRRQNAQTLALPSRKSLGVRSRTSSGESPDSKEGEAYESRSDQSENDEDSEDSESEESERQDPALVSFIGQQRKLWDEIDGIDLEEDLM